MGAPESARGPRALVIGLSTATNDEVVSSLRVQGYDATGSTDPDTAAEQYNARDFQVIAFGRGMLGPRADRLKHAFSLQDPRVTLIDAFGPIAVAQVAAALRRPGPAILVEDPTFRNVDHGGQITFRVLAACHITVTLYRQPSQTGLEEHRLFDADATEGEINCAIAMEDLPDAYSLVVVADDEEFHHLPFL